MNTFEFAENLGYTPALDIPKPSFPKFPTPFEFTSLNVSQIGNKYYGNNAVVDTKGFKVYLDEESKKIINDNNPDIPPTDLKEIILYSNQSFKEFEEFDLVLFTSTNGVTLLQQYKTVEVASDEIAIFLEIDNKTNIFGSVMRIKVGSNVLGKKDLPYAEIIKHAHNKSITISSKKLKKLLKGGVYKKKESLFRWALSNIGEVLSDTVQFITGGIGDLFFKHFPKALNKIKIEKKYWNPTTDGFEALFIPNSFIAYVEKQKGKTNAEHKIINTFIKPFFKKIDALEDNVKGKLKAIRHVLPNKVYKRIKKTLDYVFNQFEILEGLFLNSEYGFLNLILTSLQAANAFICGLYNSLVDTISGIFQLIGLVFLGVKEIADFAENTGYYASLTVEFIENSIEGILKINFLELFKELFFVPLKLVQKVVQFVSTQAKLSIQEVHYYLGYIVGFIVETTISILFTGGALTVDKVLLKTFKEPVDLLLKGYKGAVKAAKSLLSKLMVAFKKILKALSNPKQLINDFLKFLDELFGIGKKVKVFKHLEDFKLLRSKYQNEELVVKLWKKSIKQEFLFPNNLKKIYNKYLKKYPNLRKGFNQAEFKTTIYKKGKKIDEFVEYSISGDMNKLIANFGNPPSLPTNTINIIDDFETFEKFVEGAVDFNGRARGYDSEIKYIFNFLKEHIDKGDEFLIHTNNIFKTCGSCQREFVMLEQYLKSLGKKIKIVVRSDESINGMRQLKDKLKIK